VPTLKSAVVMVDDRHPAFAFDSDRANGVQASRDLATILRKAIFRRGANGYIRGGPSSPNPTKHLISRRQFASTLSELAPVLPLLTTLSISELSNLSKISGIHIGADRQCTVQSGRHYVLNDYERGQDCRPRSRPRSPSFGMRWSHQ
jgi:hypothetical protein